IVGGRESKGSVGTIDYGQAANSTIEKSLRVARSNPISETASHLSRGDHMVIPFLRLMNLRPTFSMRAGIFACLLMLPILFSGVANLPAAEKTSAAENRYYEMVTIPIPQGITLEAGALQFLPDGKLASSTRFGDIYIIDHPLENPPINVTFTHFASGLHEVLGLAYRDGWLYCTQRGEVTRMKDTN